MSDFCDVGGFNCKYCHDGECAFFDMGSGSISDMPCAKWTRCNYSFDEMLPDNTIKISREEFSTNAGLCIENDMPGLTRIQKSLLYEYGRKLEQKLFDVE